MNICGYGPDLTGSAGSWTAYHMSFRGRIYPFFGDTPNLGMIDDGFITESETGWAMHGSKQNFCYNVHYRGRCFRLGGLEPQSDSGYPDLPYWKLRYRYAYGTTTRMVNYPFPMSTGIEVLHEMSGFDGVEPGWRKVKGTVFVYNICIPVTHPNHSDWNCYIMYNRIAISYTSEDSNSAGINSLPVSNVTNPLNSYLTMYIYVYGDVTSSSSVGNVRCHLYIDPWTLELKIEPDMSTARFTNPSYPIRNVVDMQDPLLAELPNYDDRTFFSPEKSFGLSYDWEEAMLTGLNQVNFFDSNGMAFVHDVASLPTTILSDIRSLRSLAKADPTGKLKIAASTFLSVHYGYKLLAADGIELATELAEYTTKYVLHIGQTVRPTIQLDTVGDRHLTSASGHLNVYYNPYDQITSEIGKFAEAVDLTPDISNVWDMIPFSFVVDWFTNIGDLASSIDDYFTLTQQHKVLGSIRSRKVEYTYKPAGFFGAVLCTRFIRDPNEGWFPVPRFSFQFQNPVTNLYHWLEGSALVVSKIL